MRAERAALMRFGEVEVALSTDALLAFLAHDGDPEDDGALDLAACLGEGAIGEPREVLVRTAGAPLRLRVGAIRVEEVPAAQPVPALLTGLCARIAAKGLIPRGEGFALLLDPDGLVRLR
ncbi:MAG: hypothetical protein VYE22_40885 [Myxococcota bacterium]|nr:hypothetical protein [Myxococcota bacterium]